MKNYLLVLILVVFGASTSFARTSERNFQASAGQRFIQGNIAYETGEVESIFSGDVDIKDTRINLFYEGAFSDNFAAYFGIGYGSGELGSDDYEGFDPINFGVKYQSVTEASRFFARVNLGYGLEEVDEENRTANVLALNLKLGYEVSVNETSLFGVSGAYTVLSTDAKYEDDTDEPTDGSAELSVYFEDHQSNGLVLGAHVDYQVTSLFTYVDYMPEDFDFSAIEFGAYTRYQFFDDTYVLAGIDYLLSVDEPVFAEDLSRLTLNVGVRAFF